MDITEYLILTDEKQWDALWDQGKYLHTFKSIDCSFVLYTIDNFFVEVELSPDKGHIVGKSVFKDGVRLEKYTLDFNIIPDSWQE